MSPDECKAIVRRFVLGAQGRGQLALVDELMSPDFVDHSAWPGFTPDRDGVKRLFVALRTGLPDMTVTIHDQIAEADRVAMRKTLSGTHLGDFFGIPPTGKTVNLEVIDILRVRDGLITDHWKIVDQQGMLQQLGLVPAPAEA